MNIVLRIFLIIVIALAALVIGLILRHLLVRRLKKTVLDPWFVQTLGIIIIILLLILAFPVAFLIADTSLFNSAWNAITTQIRIQDVTALAWNLVETILIIVLSLGIARTAVALTIRGFGHNRIDINIRTLIGRISYILVLVLATFWVLSIWQIQIGIPIAALGIITVAFTVSIQDILKDLVAGFYILMERPFHIGDQITISSPGLPNHTGKVEDVSIRITKLRLVSGEEVSVPNAMVFANIVINNTFYHERRATISATLDEEAFVKGETHDLIIKALNKVDTIQAKPEPSIVLSGYTGKKLTLTIRFWIGRGEHTSISNVMHALRSVLPNADLTVQENAGDV